MEARAAVIGNIVFDKTVSSDKELVVGGKNSFSDVFCNTGGPASNAASVLTKYGDDMEFYGQIGDDFEGQYVLHELEMEGTNLSHLNIEPGRITPSSFIIVYTVDGTRTINSVRPIEDFINPKIKTIDYGEGYDFILTDGKYATDTKILIDKNPDAISIIDAGRTNPEVVELCEHINYIICSEEFANGVTKMKIGYDYDNICREYRLLQERYPNAKGITITIGERGYICEKDGQVEIFPAYDSGLPAIDTNGAGDIFHGAFTHAMMQGHDYYKSLEFANVTASLSTTKKGGRKSIPELYEVKEIVFGTKKLVR